ncbi:MAG TPA: phosphatase PAP2 family protein [Myxococcota bacterium]|nr:phosphatase PAP2 family protein [Myxococcota bacterium]
MLTLGCVGFVAVGVVLSLLTGAPFVVPAGQSPALGTNFAMPLVAAVAGYATLQFGSRLRRGAEVGRMLWSRQVLVDVYLLALFVVVIYVHFHVKMWVPLVNPRSYDASYFAVDERLHAVIEGLRAVRRALAALIPSADIWYELGFFSMFSLSFWFHAASRRRWHYHNMVSLVVAEVLGALLYLVAPAVGPFVFERGDNAMATEGQLRMYDQYLAFKAGGVQWLAAHGSGYFTAPLAAMPSLHLAAALVMAYYAVRARLLIAPFAVAVVGWIAIESVVSRWHYLVDLPAGLAVALVSIFVANRVCRHRLAEPHPAPASRELLRPEGRLA